VAALLVGAELRAVGRRLARGPARPDWPWRVELQVAALRAVMERSKRRGVHWLRDAQALVPARSAALRQVRFERIDAGGVPAAWCTPAARPLASPARTLVYLHGGGYVIGSPESHRDLAARLALGAGARVLLVDYRLAPEHRFPAALDDCVTAVRWLLAGGAEPRRLAIAGDSAGGALAVATLCVLRDAGERGPAAGVLLCPWTEPLAAGGSMVANEPFDFGDRALLVGWVEAYAPGEAARDPRVSVLDARLDGLPPLLVQVGGAEILLDQVRAFVERARGAGVAVQLEEWPGMYHDWQLQAAMLPEGRRAVEGIVTFLEGVFGRR
jgi:acetyl esterase/lipase